MTQPGCRSALGKALPFDELKRRYKAMQEPLLRAITSMSPEALTARPPAQAGGGGSRG